MTAKLKQGLISFGSHFSAWLIVSLIAALITWLFPKVYPYTITWSIVCLLGIMSIWDAINFDLGIRHLLCYGLAIFFAIAVFLYSIIDWLLIHQIPIQLRKVLLIESLPVALLLFLFFLILVDLEEEPSLVRRSDQNRVTVAT